MAKVTTELNVTQIKNAKPTAKDYKMTDGKGLFLLVKKSGSKLWRFRYKRPFTGKETDLGLGSFPEMSLAQARAKRAEYLALLAQDIDPQQHKEQTKRLEQQRITNTFRSVAENWKESKNGNIKPLTLSKYWGIIENYLMPKLADYPISEITPLLAKSALEIPYKQGKAEMYRKSVKLLNAILNHAVYSLFLRHIGQNSWSFCILYVYRTKKLVMIISSLPYQLFLFKKSCINKFLCFLVKPL